MDSGRSNASSVRGGSSGKKMRKRKELDALVGGVSGKRINGGSKRPGSGGVSPQDQLLSESTGEEDYWSSTKMNGSTKRNYSAQGAKRGPNSCSTLLRLCTILLIMACVVATITVMWLFIDLREQTTYLRSQLDQVAAGSQEVPEEIQKCHSLSRQLQINQTQIFSQMSFMVQRLTNFSNLISVIQGGLVDVQSKLHGSPELVNVPNHLKELTASVANFGSQIQDLQTTAHHLTQEQKALSEDIDGIKLNITTFSGFLKDLKNIVSQNITKPSNESEEADKRLVSLIMERLNVNISRINQTLTHRLSWVIDDQKKDHSAIDVLQEKSANLSSQLLTLQNVFSNLSSNCTALSYQIRTIQEDLTKIPTHSEHSFSTDDGSNPSPEVLLEDISEKSMNSSLQTSSSSNSTVRQ